MSTATETPRAFIDLPGFEFWGYGEGYLLPMFGVGVKIDVYRKRGGTTAAIRNYARTQSAAHPNNPDLWTIKTGKDHGYTVVYVAVR